MDFHLPRATQREAALLDQWRHGRPRTEQRRGLIGREATRKIHYFADPPRSIEDAGDEKVSETNVRCYL